MARCLNSCSSALRAEIRATCSVLLRVKKTLHSLSVVSHLGYGSGKWRDRWFCCICHIIQMKGITYVTTLYVSYNSLIQSNLHILVYTLRAFLKGNLMVLGFELTSCWFKVEHLNHWVKAARGLLRYTCANTTLSKFTHYLRMSLVRTWKCANGSIHLLLTKLVRHLEYNYCNADQRIV